MNVMATAWKLYRENNWLRLPFDRKSFAKYLRTAWAMQRNPVAHTITDAERKQISMGA